MVDLVKETIRSEKIAKYNHNHDERGRFCSGDGRSSFKYLNKCDFIPDDEKELYKGWIKTEAKKAVEFDERLGIKESDVIAEFDKRAFNNIPGYVSNISDHVFRKVAYQSDSIVAGAVYDYSKKKLGVEFSGFFKEDTDMKAIIDFVDGSSWVKENIGSNDLIDTFSSSNLKIGELAYFWNKTYHGDNGIEHRRVLMLSSEEFTIYGECASGKTKKRGLHPEGFSPAQVGAHEYAHAFTDSIISKVDVKLPNGSVEDAILARAFSKSEESMYIQASKVSGYAMESIPECFAECIGDYYSNRENAAPLSKEVFRVATEEIDDVIQELNQQGGAL